MREQITREREREKGGGGGRGGAGQSFIPYAIKESLKIEKDLQINGRSQGQTDIYKSVYQSSAYFSEFGRLVIKMSGLGMFEFDLR